MVIEDEKTFWHLEKDEARSAFYHCISQCSKSGASACNRPWIESPAKSVITTTIMKFSQ